MKYIKAYEQFDPADFEDFSEDEIFGVDYGKLIRFSDLVGKIITNIQVNNNDSEIIFTLKNGDEYKMFHEQNCCERVRLEDIVGDLDDLLNTPIINASEDTNRDNPLSNYDESFTWTFYNISTIKGYVTIRWYGTSNGYYSEGVDFVRIDYLN